MAKQAADLGFVPADLPLVRVASAVEHHAPQVEGPDLSTRPWFRAKRRNHRSKR